MSLVTVMIYETHDKINSFTKNIGEMLSPFFSNLNIGKFYSYVATIHLRIE